MLWTHPGPTASASDMMQQMWPLQVSTMLLPQPPVDESFFQIIQSSNYWLEIFCLKSLILLWLSFMGTPTFSSPQLTCKTRAIVKRILFNKLTNIWTSNKAIVLLCAIDPDWTCKRKCRYINHNLSSLSSQPCRLLWPRSFPQWWFSWIPKTIR